MTSGQKPRAFRITPEPPSNASVTTTPLSPGPQTRIVEEPFEIVDAADGVAVPVAPKRRSPLSTAAWHTSATLTKSRRCWPSSKRSGARPFRSRAAKIASTPV